MKNKLISLILVLCLALCAFSLYSCDESTKESAYGVISEAIKNTNNQDAYSADMKMTVSMAMPGMTLDIPVDITMQAKNLKSGKPLVAAKTSTTMFGQTVLVETYCDENWLYMSQDGDSYKVSLSDAADLGYDYTNDMSETIKELPEKLFESKELSENTDGSKTIAFSLDAATFAEVFGDLSQTIGESAGDDIFKDATVSEASVAVTVKDGLVVSYDVSFNMSYTIGSDTASLEAKIEVDFTGYGSSVTVTPPENYKSFPEIEEG